MKSFMRLPKVHHQILFFVMTSFISLSFALEGAQGPSPTTPSLRIRPLKMTFEDPFKYCEYVKTIDAPDARYVGEKYPKEVTDAFDIGPESVRFGIFWRCQNGQVYGCYVGANIPCESKADTGRVPKKALKSWCRKTLDGDIPAFVTGRETIFAWECRDGRPKIKRQLAEVDEAGYQKIFWKRIDSGLENGHDQR